MRGSATLIGGAALVAATVLATGYGAAAEESLLAGDEAAWTVLDARDPLQGPLEDEAARLAKEFGVSLPDARLRTVEAEIASEIVLRVGTHVSVLVARIEHTPEHQVVRVVAEPGAEDAVRKFVEAQISELGLSNARAVVVAGAMKKSERDGARMQFEEALQSSGAKGPILVSTHPDTGAIEVTVDSAAAAPGIEQVADAASAGRSGIFEPIEYSSVGATALAGGGEVLTPTGGGGRCTSGFGVRDGTGPAILTAGHCNDLMELTSTSSNVPQTIGLDSAIHRGNNSTTRIDRQVHRLSHDGGGLPDPSIRVTTAGQRQLINAGTATANGRFICQYGQRSNQNFCGEVSATDASYTDGNGVQYTGLIRTNANIRGGDSGGPVYTGNSAVGMMVAGRGTCLETNSTGDCVHFPDTVMEPIAVALSGTGFTLIGAGDGSRYVGLTSPTRPYETPSAGAPNRHAAGGLGVNVRVKGVGNVPSGSIVSAVVVNVTAVNPSAGGFLQVYGANQTRPVSTTMNYEAGVATAQQVTVGLGNTDEITIYTLRDTDVIVDVIGYYRLDTGTRLTAFSTPQRVATSLTDNIPPNGFIDVQLPSVVPDDADSVVMNLTAIDQTAPTFISAYRPGISRPPHSSLNPRPGIAVANQVIAKIRDDGSTASVRLYNAAGTTDTIVDVLGYYSNSTGAMNVVPIRPVRLADSRNGTNTTASKIGQNVARSVTLANVTSIAPAVPSGADGVIVRLIAIESTAPTFLTVSRAGTSATSTLNVNFAGQVVSNSATVPLSGSSIQVFNRWGSTHFVIDVEGYFYN